MFFCPVKYFPVITVLVLIITPAQADSISIPNHSFEVPMIDPNENPFLAIPFVSLWTEDDIDPCSLNTGTFINTPPGNDNHLFNVDGNQLAFLGSRYGNALWQCLPATYQQGKSYRLTVGVCISTRIPVPQGTPLVLALHYLSDPNLALNYLSDPNIVSVNVPAPPPSSRTIEDFSVTLPTVDPNDPWADEYIGIAIRATDAEGFWDLDNVRLMEYPRTPEFTGNSFVDLADFTRMAAEWQSCSEPQTDVTGDGCVNAEDLMILIQYWLNDV